jgi:predicted DsbA family dithiol-disulfide isomerase
MYREQAPDEPPPAVRWLPFQLNPDIPAAGMSRQAYIERKFGPGGARNYDRVAAVGRDVGIDFNFGAITVQPNTLEAHRLMHYATRAGCDDAVADSLFRAYFEEGAVLTDLGVLAQIGERAGLDEAALRAYLESGEDRELVLAQDIQARQAGIGGVPFFIFSRKVAVSGAHEPETLLAAMKQALES